MKLKGNTLSMEPQTLSSTTDRRRDRSTILQAGQRPKQKNQLTLSGRWRIALSL